MQTLDTYKRIHFIGAGGAGMSAVASVLIARGFEVSGSDIAQSETTRNLARGGAKIFEGHRAENIEAAELIVISTAIDPENPELVAARKAGTPIAHRSEVLAAIMSAGRGIAISGTHGKTTTTTMLGLCLYEAAMDPTVLVGGWVPEFGGNALSGKGEWIVAEADESDGSFLKFSPDRIVITNIEADHLDFYRDIDHVAETFEEFTRNLRPGGKAICCVDCPQVVQLVAGGTFEAITYGIENDEADLCARDLRYRSEDSLLEFNAIWKGESIGNFALRIPGRHNVSNALATIAIGLDLGVPIEPMRNALASLLGARRRFEIKGAVDGITVVDDYAHHPTEVQATLEAASDRNADSSSGRIVALFQPHRYSRTASMAEKFGEAFGAADLLIVTDVYAAGEPAIDGVSGLSIVRQVLSHGGEEVLYLPQPGEALNYLCEELRSGDMLLTLGAGDVWNVGEAFLDRRRAMGGVASDSFASGSV